MKISVGQIWEATIPVKREIIGIENDIIFFSVDGEQEEESKSEFARWILTHKAEISEEESGEYTCDECQRPVSKEIYDLYDGCCKNCYNELNNF